MRYVVLITLFVLPLSTPAAWTVQCEEATIYREKIMGSGGRAVTLTVPETTRTCHDVWIPDRDQTKDTKQQIELMTAMVKLCKDLELEPCVEYLTKLSVGAHE